MKKYLLTIIANFESEELCKEIAINLAPIVDSEIIKFQYTNGVMIICFNSEFKKTEIFEYVKESYENLTESFILTEINDNVSVSFPKEVLGHLFDDTEKASEINLEFDKKNLKKSSVENLQIDENILALLLGEKEEILVRPSLNQLLEKISEKGYESLTQFEKDTLEDYSKN